MSSDAYHQTRLFEFDLYKAFLIFAMISSHALEVVFSRNYGDFGFCSDSAYSVFIEVFSILSGPLVFMFMMGALLSFGERRNPSRLIRRGRSLLLLWFALNFVRSVPAAILDCNGNAGSSFAARVCVYTFVNDIFFFAGLFFVYVGFLRRLGASDFAVFGVSVLLYGASRIIGDIGSVVQFPFLLLTAGFVRTGHWSSFPFLAWAILPSLGMLWGRILGRFSENRRWIYVLLLPASILVLVALSPMLRSAGLFDGAALLAMRGDPLGMHANGPLPLACGLAMCGVVFSFFFFLSPLLRWGCLGTTVTKLGRDLPLIYVVQWVLLPFVALATRRWLVPVSDGAVVAGCLAIATASIVLAELVGGRIKR